MKPDVCLITEGSYPYVVGGVSTWVHELISNLKDISFAVVHIGVSKEIAGEIKYQLPKNVVDYRETFILESVPYRGMSLLPKRKAWQELEKVIHDIANWDLSHVDDILYRYAEETVDRLTPYDIFHSKRFWNILVSIYERYFKGFSFIDFFWSMRAMVLPLFKIFYAKIPYASLYHATCTGYAGLYGVLAKLKTRSPFIITEHGIYTNERMIEITQAKWIYKEPMTDVLPPRQLGKLQNLWMKKFEVLSRISYDHANQIFTLYEGNRVMQLEGGADHKKTAIIPNGIEISRFEQIRNKRNNLIREGTKNIAMIGRVAPIKDVKTFIRAAKIVSRTMPDVTFLVLGPTDEDTGYYEECLRLVRVLSLEKHLHFKGAVKVDDYYPLIDCVVLTSISEAQPFVVLESMSIGIPVVATNVGACAELLLGADKDDQALGPAGIITNIRSPEETAKAIMFILSDPEKARKMGEAGIKRVETYYDRRKMLTKYHEIYRQYCGGRWNS